MWLGQFKIFRGRVRRGPRVCTGAEGATAPETLRQTDRERMTLWKVALRIA